MLSICSEFLSNRRQRVVVDGATVSGSESFLAFHREVCWVLFCSSYITAKCLIWLSTDYMPRQMTPHYWQLFARQQTDLLNNDLVRMLEWCNHCCMMLNPNKSKTLVVSRLRTVNPPNGYLGLSGVSIRVDPSLDILNVKFDRKLTFEDHL